MGDLLFAGTEFGLYVILRRRRAVDRAQRRAAPGPGPGHDRAKAGERPRPRHVRTRILRPGRFQSLSGRSTEETLAADAHLFSLRDAYLFNTTGLAPAGSASIGDLSGNFTTPNPPDGAVFTYHVDPGAPAGGHPGASDQASLRRAGEGDPVGRFAGAPQGGVGPPDRSAGTRSRAGGPGSSGELPGAGPPGTPRGAGTVRRLHRLEIRGRSGRDRSQPELPRGEGGLVS